MKKEFFIGNRKRITEALEPNSLMVLFAGKAPHASADMSYYPFVPNKNFYYLTGIDQEESIFLVEKNGFEINEMLFVKKSNPDKERWDGKVLSDEEAREISGIDAVSFIDDLRDYLGDRIFRHSFQNLYLDFERYSYDDEVKLAHIFARDILKKYPHLNIKNIFPEIRDMRMIKQPAEIAETRKAIDATRLGIENVLANAQPDMREYQLEAYFDFACKTKGLRPAFQSIVVAGENAWTLHYVKNDCVVENGNLVLLDVGVASGHYSADISRTFPINGKFTERQLQVYSVVLRVQDAVINAVRPGVLFGDLNMLANELLVEECEKIGLIKENKDLAEYYYHGIGHTLGLDVHDPRDMNPGLRLKEGMIITIEPGLYIKEEGIGIRIEDDILVTRCWHENLSKDIIKDPYEIEMFMQIAMIESFNK